METECPGVNTTAKFPPFPTGTGLVGGSGSGSSASGTLGQGATATAAGSGRGSATSSAGRVVGGMALAGMVWVLSSVVGGWMLK